MHKYTITISNDFNTLTGDFKAMTAELAITDAKDFYSHELDTNPDDIEIISFIKIN